MMKIPFIIVLLGIFALAMGLQIPTSANSPESIISDDLYYDHAKHGKH
jgi:hypothetical protein